jgi:hypothetical protein
MVWRWIQRFSKVCPSADRSASNERGVWGACGGRGWTIRRARPRCVREGSAPLASAFAGYRVKGMPVLGFAHVGRVDVCFDTHRLDIEVRAQAAHISGLRPGPNPGSTESAPTTVRARATNDRMRRSGQRTVCSAESASNWRSEQNLCKLCSRARDKTGDHLTGGHGCDRFPIETTPCLVGGRARRHRGAGIHDAPFPEPGARGRRHCAARCHRHCLVRATDRCFHISKADGLRSSLKCSSRGYGTWHSSRVRWPRHLPGNRPPTQFLAP